MDQQRCAHAAFGLSTAAIAVSIPLVPIRGYAISASAVLGVVLLGWLFYAVSHR